MKKLLCFSCFSFLLYTQILIAQSCPAASDVADIDAMTGTVTLALDMSFDVEDITSITIAGTAVTINGDDPVANTITFTVSPALAATIAGSGLTFNTVFTGNTTLNCNYVMGNLPVELTSFQASKSSQGIELSWSTASEVNNEMFQVERSGDGQSFSAIGAIAGAGTTDEAQAYAFMDKSPLPGLNYYRLKQMDFDGQFEYSDIVSAWVESSSLRIYPNPTQGQIKITLPDAEVKGTYQVFNPAGQVLLQGALQGDLIDLSSINNGLYYLQINTNGRIETQKIQKQ